MRRTRSTPAVRQRSRSPRRYVSQTKAIKTWAFWLTLIGLVAATFTYQGVLTQLRQHFGENGFAPAAATSAVTFIATMGIASKTRLRTRQRALQRTQDDRPQHRLPSRRRRSDDPPLRRHPPHRRRHLRLQPRLRRTRSTHRTSSSSRPSDSANTPVPHGPLPIRPDHLQLAGGPVLAAGACHDETGSFDIAFATIVGIFILGMITLFLAPQLRDIGDGRLAPKTTWADRCNRVPK